MGIKFILLIILLFTLLISVKIYANPEITNQQASLAFINSQLNKYCMNCEEKSLSKFIVIVHKLETLINSQKEKQKVSQYQLLLAKAYKHLAFKFYSDDEVNKELFISKEFEMLQLLLDFSNNSKMLNLALDFQKDRYYTHFRALRNNPDKQSYWLKKINDIRSRYIEKIKHIDRLVIIKGIIVQDNKTIKILLDEIDDLQVIELIHELNNINTRPSKDLLARLENVADVLLVVIKNNKIPHTDISFLKRAAISAINFRVAINAKTLDEIIWWCMARSIDDEIELKKFLKNQIDSKRKEDAIMLIKELGYDL